MYVFVLSKPSDGQNSWLSPSRKKYRGRSGYVTMTERTSIVPNLHAILHIASRASRHRLLRLERPGCITCGSQAT